MHEFIPLDEIWVSEYHWENCWCKKNLEKQKLSQNYFKSTIIHEITEFIEMQNWKDFWTAHNIALEKEIEIWLITDPFSDI